MGTRSNIDPCEFVEAVQPLIERRDVGALIDLVKSRWTAGDVVSLLSSTSCDARKVAALVMSLIGGKCCIEELAVALKDPDPMVNEMAEHALWSIWFRLGNCESRGCLQRGADALNDRELDTAIVHFSRAVEIDPTFAEAYNQRAIAMYLADRFEDSIRDCESALKYMPCHFGAWAGLGHCHAYLGRYAEAASCYLKALDINPHLKGIRETLSEIRERS